MAALGLRERPRNQIEVVERDPALATVALDGYGAEQGFATDQMSRSLSLGISRSRPSLSGTTLMSRSIVLSRHPRSTAVAPPVR
jgi:hypothetical protein